MRKLITAATLAVALLVVATPAMAQNKRGDRNLISRQDIDEAGASVTNAQDAVQRLRPNWLRPSMGRMATSGTTDNGAVGSNASAPVVYIDDRRQPEVDILRTVPVAKIKEIKYMDQNRAIQMLGPGHEAGAILVFTMK